MALVTEIQRVHLFQRSVELDLSRAFKADGRAMREVAGEVMAYMTANNYEVSERGSRRLAFDDEDYDQDSREASHLVERASLVALVAVGRFLFERRPGETITFKGKIEASKSQASGTPATVLKIPLGFESGRDRSRARTIESVLKIHGYRERARLNSRSFRKRTKRISRPVVGRRSFSLAFFTFVGLASLAFLRRLSSRTCFEL